MSTTSKHTLLDELPHDAQHLDERGRPYLPTEFRRLAANHWTKEKDPFAAARQRAEEDLTAAVERYLRWLEKRIHAQISLEHKRAKQTPIEDLVSDSSVWAAAREQFAVTGSVLAQELMREGAMLVRSILPNVDFDLANTTVYELSSSYFDEWWMALEESTRRQLRAAIQAHIASGTPLSSLRRSLEPLFGRQRAQVIAATEVTRLFSLGNIIAYQTAGVEVVEWRTAVDERVCPVCQPRNGEHYYIGTVPGVVRMPPLDVRPPAHPACRCWLAPVVELPR